MVQPQDLRSRALAPSKVAERLSAVLRWLAPFSVGFVLSALLFFVRSNWGGLLSQITILFAAAAMVLILSSALIYMRYKYIVATRLRRHLDRLKYMARLVIRRPGIVTDERFWVRRVFPFSRPFAKIAFVWLGSAGSIALSMTFVANLALFATVTVQLVQADRLTTQNQLLAQQNLLLSQQNVLVTDQNYLSESARRSGLVQELSDILNEIDEELDAQGAVLEDSVETFPLTPRLKSRIAAQSNALTPYRFLTDSGEISPIPLSPERGQMLQALIGTRIDLRDLWPNVNFSRSFFDKAQLQQKDLRNAVLPHSSFRYANLTGSELDNAELQNCDFTGAILYNVDLTGAVLYGSTFNGAVLPEAELLRGVNLIEAKLEGALVTEIDWLSEVAAVEAALELDKYYIERRAVTLPVHIFENITVAFPIKKL